MNYVGKKVCWPVEDGPRHGVVVEPPTSGAFKAIWVLFDDAQTPVHFDLSPRLNGWKPALELLPTGFCGSCDAPFYDGRVDYLCEECRYD